MPAVQVFVSHAHADNALCDRYVAALRARGLDVWYDRTSLQDGHMLSADIERELEQRRAFVVLLTPASVASYWVNLEIAAFRSLAAQDSTRLMLPVRIADCKVPLLMAGIKWVDAVSLGFDAAVNAMAVALGAPAAKPTPQPVENVDDLLKRARLLYTSGANTEEAIRLLEHATQLSPRRADAWSALGEAYYRADRDYDAVSALDRALALDETVSRAWEYKGLALGSLHRPEEALAAYDRALKLDPNSKLAWVGKGVALGFLSRFGEAFAAYDRALAIDPNFALAWDMKASDLRKVGRKLEAQELERRAKELRNKP